MKTVATLALAALVLAAAAPAAAQVALDRSHVWGLGIQTLFPYDELGDEADTGWGIQAIADYPLIPLIDLCGRVGWNRFPHAADGDAIEVWEVTAGARLAFGVFYMGGEVGWYDRGDEWSWVPSIGLRFDRVEVSLRWRSVGRNAFTSAGVGWYF